MESDYLNHAEHQNIRLFKMIENNNDLPFFITQVWRHIFPNPSIPRFSEH